MLFSESGVHQAQGQEGMQELQRNDHENINSFTVITISQQKIVKHKVQRLYMYNRERVT